MKRKLSNQFLTQYLIVFVLTAAATFLAFAMLSLASGLIENTLAKNRYTARSIIKEDYRQIDVSSVVQNGGGVQIIDREYRIVFSDGIDTIGKSQLTAEEFTAFLIQSKDKSYHYDILYQPKGEFWLVVTFPTSLRIDFAVIYNKDALTGDLTGVVGVISGVFVVYLLLLSIITFIYSRITASGITAPLRKLSDGTKLLREGNYSARVDLKLKNEFAELQDTFNDMAARIEHEMALRKKAEEDRRRLILDISHDLKNPLASVCGYAELCLENSELSQQEQKSYLQVIRNNSQRANVLLSELFELSKLDSPEFSLKTEKTDLCEYLRQVCGELLPALESAGFEYEFDIPEESIFVLIDRGQFSRIFQNLGDNAIRYNPKGTTIRIGVTQKSEKAIILFRDDGIGISPELAQDVFNPFVKADNSRSSQTGGSGLGLAIAKKIAQSHGGDLSLSDASPGCAFQITLPII